MSVVVSLWPAGMGVCKEQHVYVQSKVWPHYGQNKESVAQLWVGLLCFYVEEFNVKEHVVCIRQHERLARFDKMWTGTNIAIEGKFSVTSNSLLMVVICFSVTVDCVLSLSTTLVCAVLAYARFALFAQIRLI